MVDPTSALATHGGMCKKTPPGEDLTASLVSCKYHARALACAYASKRKSKRRSTSMPLASTLCVCVTKVKGSSCGSVSSRMFDERCYECPRPLAGTTRRSAINAK
eukprot:7037866-Pyramimonas_sp.AAC.1